jgi:hypothetical protein
MAHVTHHPSHPIFPQDFAEHMLEVPRRRPRFDWFLFAIVAGTIVGGVVMVLSNLLF